MENSLTKRLFNFAINVIRYLRKLPNEPEVKILKYQLVKSSKSSGANYEESQGAPARADFAFKVGLAFKEMRESNYWIKVILCAFDLEEATGNYFKELEY